MNNRTFAPLGRALAVLVTATALLAPAGVSAQTHRSQRPSPAPTMQSSATSSGVVNINTATEPQLAALPGIGASKAHAIVEARGRHRFGRVEDILRVRGIGRATFRRLHPMLRVDGPTTLGAP